MQVKSAGGFTLKGHLGYALPKHAEIVIVYFPCTVSNKPDKRCPNIVCFLQLNGRLVKGMCVVGDGAVPAERSGPMG